MVLQFGKFVTPHACLANFAGQSNTVFNKKYQNSVFITEDMKTGSEWVKEYDHASFAVFAAMASSMEDAIVTYS